MTTRTLDTRVNLEMSTALKTSVDRLAAANGLTRNAFMRLVLQQTVAIAPLAKP